VKLVRRIGAIVIALLLLATGLAGLELDRRYPAQRSAARQATTVDVLPGAVSAVCPGAVKLPTAGEGEVVYDPDFDPRPTTFSSLTNLIVEGQDASVVTVSGQAVAELSGPLAVMSDRTDLPILAQAWSGSDQVATVAGATFQYQLDGDLRGTAAASCITPSADSWLVAGSTETGSSSQLLLVNAGLTNVTVSIDLWDGAGPVEAIGLDGLVVPSRSERAVLLEGFVGNSSRLAIHVTASGGELAVFLQHSRMEGLVPGGVEIAVPVAPPGTSVKVPGLSVVESTFDSARTSVLRVANPGDQAAVISVQLWGSSGPLTLPGLEEATVNPGLVTDLSLGGLPADTYVAVIESSQPVAVAGLALRPGQPSQDGAGIGPEEFAWSSSMPSPADGIVPLPGADLSSQLVLAAETTTDVWLSGIGQDGRRFSGQMVTVPALTAVLIDPAALVGGGETAGSADELAAIEYSWAGTAGAGAVALTVSGLTDAAIISVLSPVGEPASATQVSVYPLRP
jgi:hypothetical protein